MTRATGEGRLGYQWTPPRGAQHRGALAARVLGHGPPIVLLHGLVGSGRYWGGAFDRLADHHQLVVPDLLGFGRSPRPAHGYDADAHAQAVLACLDEVGATAAAVIGAHSAGTTVALSLAVSNPDRVRAIVAFGPPLYPTTEAARSHLGAMGPMARLLTLPGPFAATACRWVCRHRTIAARLAVATHRGLPAAVAADSVQHTWESYSETLDHLILSADGSTWLEQAACPVRLVAGADDRVTDVPYLQTLAAPLSVWPGDHHLPLRCPERCSDLLGEA